MSLDASVTKPTSIIFLDIDGVLMGDRSHPVQAELIRKKVHELFIKKEGLNRGFTEQEWRIAATHFFSPQAVGNLEQLIEKVSQWANVAIVISSQWREDGSVADLRDKMFNLYPFSQRIIDKTPDCENWQRKSRGQQIDFWLNENKKKINVKSFVILDDCNFDLAEFFPSRFVKVTVENLLSESDIRKAHHIMTQFSDALQAEANQISTPSSLF